VNSPSESKKEGVGGYRRRLLAAMMLVVISITGLALFFIQRSVASNAERDLEREFRAELADLHHAQEIRHAALVERCRALVGKPRIHAALEDNALDLLYPSAREEMRDIMEADAVAAPDVAAYTLHAYFYRFLDVNGAVIAPPDPKDVGELAPDEEAQLAFSKLPDKQQVGYLVKKGGGESHGVPVEVIAMPIVSGESGEVIAALVLGFKPVVLSGTQAGMEMKSGLYFSGSLHLSEAWPAAESALGAEVSRALAAKDRSESRFATKIDQTPHLLFYKLLNADSLFPPAYEICVYPLLGVMERQWMLRWQILGAGGLLLLGGWGASHLLSGRLSEPVERLAVDSAENQSQRERAEAALESTTVELQRSARFSADASHQLKTPVTVLRAGLEEMLARDGLPAEVRHEVSALIHQTFRITSIVEDLLLLSRMDAGRLQIEFSTVDLRQVVEILLDDLGALPDGLNLEIESDLPERLFMAGEKRYAFLILQNLLENARKYNRPGGKIRVAAYEDGSWVSLTIANKGRPIPEATQEHIFERFHRGSAGGNVPGHGLGLNLARELARLHRGDLRLLRSDEEWTEFMVRFLPAQDIPVPPAPRA
jgi:signal transduction histidine kinase